MKSAPTSRARKSMLHRALKAENPLGSLLVIKREILIHSYNYAFRAQNNPALPLRARKGLP